MLSFTLILLNEVCNIQELKFLHDKELGHDGTMKGIANQGRVILLMPVENEPE